MQCSKDHKTKHCPATVNASETAATEGAATASNIDLQSQYLPSKVLKHVLTPRKRTRRTESDDASDSQDDEPGWNITPEMKKKLQQSTWLRKELQDGGLRHLIGMIDAASDDDEEEGEEEVDEGGSKPKYQRYKSNRGNNGSNSSISPRVLALARTKHSHPKFAAFIDQMMLTAGVLTHADDTAHNTLESLMGGGGRDGLALAPVPRPTATLGNSVAEADLDTDDDSSSDSSTEDCE